MIKDLIIIGASGFGREVAWCVERINAVRPTWNLLGFIDDNSDIQGFDINGYKVLGKTSDVVAYPNAYFVCAVGSSKVRRAIISRIKEIDPDIRFATIIDPSVECSELVTIGNGSIICAHTIATVNITIGEHVIINLDCTIGHDAVLEDFVTLYPSVNISGMSRIGCTSEMGTGAQIIQGKTVGSNTVIGAGAVIIHDIPSDCVAVGVPAAPVASK